MGFINIKKWGKKKKNKDDSHAESPKLPPRPPALPPRSQSAGSFKAGDSDDEAKKNPKTLLHSTSLIGLDTMMEEFRCDGNLPSNIVHMEVPFGKPIEEVYDGVHSGPVLGSGISGLVRLVTHKATGLKYAVKVLDLGLVENSEGLVQLREEIFIMCQLDHPNIVRLEEVYESQSEIYLVQELCLGGELFDRLDEQPDYHYTEAECARLVKQMLSAVRYLHSKGIIHRDLKLENFLFSSTAQDSELKMIDFGLSKHFAYGEVQHEAVGTPYTVSPEVIRGSYDERCDIWAIGVITFLLLSGDPPFGGCGGPEPLLQVRANILKGAFAFEPAYIWANVSEAARSFISNLLKPDPQDRPTAEDAQQHEWLKKSAACVDNVLDPNVVKALVNFKEYSDMRKLLCEVLSFTLLPYQIKELRSEFEKMDTDGSGEISLAALKQVLMANAGAGSLGALTEEEVEDIFNAMRVRKSETRIHWHEFIAAGLSQCQVDDRNLRLAFDRLDGDHKGYIILDDIMDLMGSDAAQSEEDMERMWGDSIKAVKGQHARITYDDFLLLMKGQNTDTPAQEVDPNIVAVDLSKPLPVLTEVSETVAEARPAVSADKLGKPLVNGQILSGKGVLTFAVGELSLPPPPANFDSHSAPATPTNTRQTLDTSMSMDSDEDDGIVSSGPGVPGTSASLTPPMSPSRGPEDYITPAGQGRICLEFKDPRRSGTFLPSLPTSSSSILHQQYTRRLSRSADEEDLQQKKENGSLNAMASAVHHSMLPETESGQVMAALVKDDSKSNLAVNRALYRAHRQMRLAVLDASKRFEEQQTKHARDVLTAQTENEDIDGSGRIIQAGLVMRHGHKTQISSQAIRSFLEENRREQQKLVEMATKRGGRGRRSRKKTMSDMAGMLLSMNAEELGPIAQQASEALEEELVAVPESPVGGSDSNIEHNLNDLSERGTLRSATVPGQFKKTSDPFGKQGKYGALFAKWK